MIGKPMPDKSIYLNVSQQVELTPSLLAQQLYKEFGHKDRVGFLQSFLSELENKFEDYHMAIEMAEFYLANSARSLSPTQQGGDEMNCG